jgi:ABC-type transport system involved in multi-copper enzyme maturation permease subunit
MKTYRKILGITSLLILLATVVFLVFQLLEDRISGLTFFLLLLPVYVLVHYLIASRFGFRSRFENQETFFVTSSLLSIFALILIPLTIYFFDNHENEQLREYSEKLEQPKELAAFTGMYNIECSLKTRLVDNTLEYIFSANYQDAERPEIDSFKIELKENSGFMVDEFNIDTLIRVIDYESNTISGYTKKGKIPWKDPRKYEKIQLFEAALRVK